MCVFGCARVGGLFASLPGSLREPLPAVAHVHDMLSPGDHAVTLISRDIMESLPARICSSTSIQGHFDFVF